MATGVASWSKTAATNATADSNVNWAEGMAPSAVNDSARAEMASVAKFRDDISGTVTTGGTSTAFTMTTNQGFASAAAMSGAMLCFIPHATSGAAPTLAVDGLTARAINVSTGVAVPTGALILGTPYVVTYIHASTEFILQGAVAVAILNDPLQVLSVDAGATVGPVLDLYRNSASPAASDFIGSVDFNGKDSGAAKQLYAEIIAQITDPTAASEDAIIILRAVVAGVLTDMLKTSAAGITIPGTLGVTGDVAINTNKFNVTASSGNIAAAGSVTAGANLVVSTGTVTVPAATIADAALVTPPGRTLLATLTASNSATLSDTTSFTSSYRNYELVFEQIVPATNNVTLELQVQSGGSFKSAGYACNTIVADSAGVSTQAATTFIQMSKATTLSNVGTLGMNGTFRVQNPSANAICAVTGNFVEPGTNPPHTGLVGGYWGTAGVVTGFQILMSSGNITSGTVKIYGLT